MKALFASFKGKIICLKSEPDEESEIFGNFYISDDVREYIEDEFQTGFPNDEIEIYEEDL
jgi:hypothetical protein